MFGFFQFNKTKVKFLVSQLSFVAECTDGSEECQKVVGLERERARPVLFLFLFLSMFVLVRSSIQFRFFFLVQMWAEIYMGKMKIRNDSKHQKQKKKIFFFGAHFYFFFFFELNSFPPLPPPTYIIIYYTRKSYRSKTRTWVKNRTEVHQQRKMQIETDPFQNFWNQEEQSHFEMLRQRQRIQEAQTSLESKKIERHSDVACQKCKKFNVKRIQSQERAADEGFSYRYFCMNELCGHFWRQR